MSKNSSVLKAVKSNMKLLRDAFNKPILEAAMNYAKTAVIKAVDEYIDSEDGVSLTGNTLTGFTAGVFLDGSLQKPIIRAIDVYPGIKDPTSGYTKGPGDSGFYDYDSGEYIGIQENDGDVYGDDPYVSDYSDDNLQFVNTGGSGYSYIDTENFIKSYTPKNKKGVAVVIANCSPYIEYIKDNRDMDILDSVHEKSKTDFSTALLRTVFKEELFT